MLTRRLPRLFTRRFATAAQSAVKHATPRITASILPSLASYPATRITTLPNGLRVATEKSSGETGTVGVWVDTGSRYEDQKSNGVAHFLEHLVFKGTQRRSRRQLEMEVEQVGGHLNAYTSREQTVFYAKAFKNDIPQAMDILADILQNSKFEGDAVERERDTILREMKEVDEQMEEVLFDRLHETAYRGSPLSYTILGPVENIKSITREHILDYINTHYTADRMVIAGAGAVNHDQLVELTQKLFANVPRKPAKKVSLQPAKFIGSDIRVRDDSIENAHVALAFEVAGWDDPDNFPLMLIQTMLGAWDKASSGGSHSSSPLVATLAKDKLAESMVPFNTLYSDTGLFGVHIVAPPEGLTEMMKIVLNEFVGLCYHVEEHRLNEAKNQLKMNVLAQLDGSTVICEEIGRHMLTYGRRMHPLEAIQRIDAVDANAIKSAANRFFYDRDFALAAIGQIYELPDYNWIRSRTFWRRV